MPAEQFMEVSYYPGCSLATGARESNQSLVEACNLMGLKLNELEDWNCCGSSSAHSVDRDLALGLAARNLSLAPKGRPLLTMCPSCFRNLLGASHHLKQDPELRKSQERAWGKPIDPDIEIISFLEILHFLDRLRALGSGPPLDLKKKLTGMKIAPYHGCMGMFPPSLRRLQFPYDLLNRQLISFGAEVVTWVHWRRCCGTFLTAARPDITTPLVNQIVESAVRAGADCLVTACAMCQLNLEIRCNLSKKIPVFHFSEIMALVLGARDYDGWFKRHIVDPRPLLADYGF